MSFIKKSVSFSRFKCTDDGLSSDQIREALRKKAFIPLDSVEPITGCVGILNIADTEFAFDPILDPWVVFAIRSDIRSVPKSLEKLEISKRLAEEVAKNGKVSRSRKNEITEEVALHLKQKALVNPSMKCVAWNTSTHEVWYEGTSSKQKDEFLSFFNETFGCVLEEVTPSSKALDIEPSHENAIANLQPFGDMADTPDDALSRDFMLWLWYESSLGGVVAQDQGGHEYTVSIDSAIQLANGSSRLSLSSSDETEDFTFAKQFVQDHGQTVRQVSLIYVGSDMTFRSSLAWQAITPKGIKKPTVKAEESDDESTLLLELDLIQTVLTLTDAVYTQFVQERFSPAWESRLQDIVAWIGKNR